MSQPHELKSRYVDRGPDEWDLVGWCPCGWRLILSGRPPLPALEDFYTIHLQPRTLKVGQKVRVPGVVRTRVGRIIKVHRHHRDPETYTVMWGLDTGGEEGVYKAGELVLVLPD